MSENQTPNNKPLIVAIIVIAILLLCGCLVIVGVALSGLLGALSLPWNDVFDGQVKATETLEKTFSVTAPASLSLNVNVGDVIIQTGDAQEIHIYGVKQVWGPNSRQAEQYLNDFEVQLGQTASGDVEIETEMPLSLRRVRQAPHIDLEITVPRDTQLDLNINVGEIEVTGVQGKFEIQADVGDVTLRDVRFEKDSRIRSNVGNIELRLPPDSAFTFSAQSDVGDIDVDFDVRNERSENKVVGGNIEGEIGTSPTVHVELRTNTGNIDIRKER